MIGLVPPEPACAFVLGIPGSGKSSRLVPLAEAMLGPGALMTRDADEIRIRLPEYGGGPGSMVVQPETVDITYGPGLTVPDLLKLPCHLLFDLVGDPAWLPDEVSACREAGRRVLVLCAEIDTSLAVERAMRRTVDDGRYVDVAYVRSKANHPRQALAACTLAGLDFSWAVVATGEPDLRVADTSGGIVAPDGRELRPGDRATAIGGDWGILE